MHYVLGKIASFLGPQTVGFLYRDDDVPTADASRPADIRLGLFLLDGLLLWSPSSGIDSLLILHYILSTHRMYLLGLLFFRFIRLLFCCCCLSTSTASVSDPWVYLGTGKAPSDAVSIKDFFFLGLTCPFTGWPNYGLLFRFTLHSYVTEGLFPKTKWMSSCDSIRSMLDVGKRRENELSTTHDTDRWHRYRVVRL